MVSDSLKIPTYQEDVDFVVVSRLETGDVLVNRVQLPVTTPFDCDLLIVRCGRDVGYLELAFILKVEVATEEVSHDRS
jgi:hypothetical protein